jgi:hypothetical protein
MIPDQQLNSKFRFLSRLAQKLCWFKIWRSVDRSREKKQLQILKHEFQRRVSNYNIGPWYFGFYSILRARQRQWASDSLKISQSTVTRFFRLSSSLNHNIHHWFWVFLWVCYNLFHSGCNIRHWFWVLPWIWETYRPICCNIRRESSAVFCFSFNICARSATPFADFHFFTGSEATFGNFRRNAYRWFSVLLCI